MRVMIVDDEPLARGVLREYLAGHADVELVAECANGFEAVKAIAELAPELVLLDIQMPRLNGFEVVELAGQGPRYLFVTAFDQYALKAFEVHAVDYLLKPFSQQRFDQALAHVRATLARPPAIAAVVGEALRREPIERVLIRDGAKVHVIGVADIAYIEAQSDYIALNAGGKTYLKNQPLSDIETQLDGQRFLRVHRSFIVNLACISRIEASGKDTHNALLHDGTRIPVSRSGYQKVRSLFG
ncbi:MAG: LytTR family transcriptional regulator DNA-binding domain-containing protein [Massilia sp.]